MEAPWDDVDVNVVEEDELVPWERGVPGWVPSIRIPLPYSTQSSSSPAHGKYIESWFDFVLVIVVVTRVVGTYTGVIMSSV